MFPKHRFAVPEVATAALKVAHAPVVYHFPALIIQPNWLPPVCTLRYPLPEKGVLGAV